MSSFCKVTNKVIDELVDLSNNTDGVSSLLALTYIRLLSFKNNKTNICNPSYETLTNKIGITRKSLAKHLAVLRDNGYLIIKSQKDENTQRNMLNQYFFPKEYDLTNTADLKSLEKLLKSYNMNDEWKSYKTKFIDNTRSNDDV